MCAALALLVVFASAPAAEAAGPQPQWEISSLSNTAVAPGDQLTYHLVPADVGTEPSDGTEVRLTVGLPPGMTGVSSVSTLGLSCPSVAGATGTFTCAGSPTIVPFQGDVKMTITVAVDPTASGTLATTFDLEGGGAVAAAHTVDTTRVTETTPPYGFDGFDLALTDPAGAPYTRAAGHPDQLTNAFDVVTHTEPTAVTGDDWPLEDFRDVGVELPPGIVGNPSAFGQCTFIQLSNGDSQPHPLCPPSSQLGVVAVRINGTSSGLTPLYSMVPPPDVPARFAFNFNGAIIVLDTHVRSDGDYGLTTAATNIPQTLVITGNTIDFWGVPGAPGHDARRWCPGAVEPTIGGPSCPIPGLKSAFFRQATSCTSPGAGLPILGRLDSWQHPGDFNEVPIQTHRAPGFPYPSGPATFPTGYTGPESWGEPVGTDGCAEVPFEPTLDASLTTDHADSPTGLNVDIGLPRDCWSPKPTAEEAEEALCQSDLEEAEVTLPQGLALNPSTSDGLAACTPAQVGLTTPVDSSPIHFNEAPAACPDASKIGSVEISTPLLGRHNEKGEPVTDEAGNPVLEPLHGSVYLAQQSQNPFGSLLSMYLVAEGSGVIVKQAGEIELGPNGQVTTRFREIPQQPTSDIHVSLFGGSRAALRTPAACGTYATTATLTPWSGTGAVQRQSSFQITQGCGGGFDPRLDAGTENPLAGAYSPFHLELSRADATQELAGLSLHLPPGLLANLAAIPYCPDATLAAISSALGTGASQVSNPSCPPASRLGTVTVGAGAGPTPFYTNLGRVYWAGPYKGAPVSIAAVVPALAGPFDLGTVVVRNAVHVNPDTAEITAQSDPLPTILDGIPLDLRNVRVDLDRPTFTLNPTSCEPKSLDATLTSTTGTAAARSNHFQVSGCDRLGFKPKLALKLKGKVNRTAHPSLTATYTARPGDANLKRAQVKLPSSALLDNAHIGTVCTRPQFAAHACPAKSVYGTAQATSPILGYPLKGSVYLRSSNHKLPDLVADLRGPDSQPIEVALAGRTDSVKGALRNTFEVVPDAPVTKFTLKLFGGKRGLIEMGSGFCAHPNAAVSLTAQNNRAREFSPKVQGKCSKGGGGKDSKRHR